MTQQKPRLTEPRSLDAVLKKLGVQRLEALRRADLTAELREQAGTTPEEELQLVAAGEIYSLGLPLEVAKALALGRAVGSASELASLTAEEVEHVLREPPVKDLLPEKFEINPEVIDQWLQRISPLAADEDSPARGQVAEDSEEPAASDEETALQAEDESLSRHVLDELLAALRERAGREEAALQALARGAHVELEASDVRDVLLGLQADLSDIVERFTAREPGGFAAVDEERATAFADDAMQPERDIRLLEEELVRVEGALDALRMAAESGDEDRSPAAAAEEMQGDAEVQVRGE